MKSEVDLTTRLFPPSEAMRQDRLSYSSLYRWSIVFLCLPLHNNSVVDTVNNITTSHAVTVVVYVNKRYDDVLRLRAVLRPSTLCVSEYQ